MGPGRWLGPRPCVRVCDWAEPCGRKAGPVHPWRQQGGRAAGALCVGQAPLRGLGCRRQPPAAPYCSSLLQGSDPAEAGGLT